LKRLPFYSFLTANAISLIGNYLTMIAVPWFVLETTGSAAKTGLVGFFTALPSVIATFFGGTIVDRLGHKKMSVISDIGSGVTVALIPLLYHTIGLEFWGLLVLVFFSALLDAPGNTARASLLPDLAQAGDMELERANAYTQAIQRGSVLVGPALAGLLITWIGSSNVLWLDAGTFAISAIIFMFTIPTTTYKAASDSKYLDDLKEGLRFLRQNRMILTLVITVSITNFLDAPLFSVVLPVYAKEIFGDATKLGIIFSSFGAGATIGTLIFSAIGPRLPRRLTYILSFVMVGLPFWFLAFKPPFLLVAVLMFIIGIMASPINPLIMTVTQEHIPPEMRGRVFGMISAGAFVATPLGMLLSGYLLELSSITFTILVIASGYLLVTVGQVFNKSLHAMNRPQPNQESTETVS
jgi:MFS family permease